LISLKAASRFLRILAWPALDRRSWEETWMSTLPSATGPHARLNILRCGLTGAISLAILFAICWVGALLIASQSHMFIEIFTRQPVTSVGALAEGTCWSLVFGALGGALLAIVYNALAVIVRR